MKKILISIKPKWVAKILNGEKTLEIRKSFPKCELPCEVYIYCTKLVPYGRGCMYDEVAKRYMTTFCNDGKELPNLTGRVVAKFTLNKTYLLTKEKNGYVAWCGMPCFDPTKEACVSQDDLRGYLKGKDGYAWHIDNLVIFDRPRELKEFKKVASKKTYTNLPWLEPAKKRYSSYPHLPTRPSRGAIAR